MSIFQRKIQELLPINLKINKEETESLELKPNSFNKILPYLKLNKSQFQRSEVQIGFEKNTFLRSPPRELNIQCINNNYYEEQLQTPQVLAKNEAQLLASTEEDKSLLRNNSGKITENILPSFSATNPLVCNADLKRTNVYSTLLIPGPAIFYSATHNALIGEHIISIRCCVMQQKQ